MMQPAFPACEQFHMALPGEDCNAIIAPIYLNRYEFFRINPAVNGEQGCKDNILANTWYCVKAKGGAPQPAATASSAQPTNTQHAVEPANGGKNPETRTTKAKPTSTRDEMKITTIALPNQDQCRFGDCWYAFGTLSTGKEEKLATASSICNKLLVHGCKDSFDWPGHIEKLCGDCTELSSACPCFLAGHYHTRTLNPMYSRSWDGKDWYWPGDDGK
jgi:hypothetical protein